LPLIERVIIEIYSNGGNLLFDFPLLNEFFPGFDDIAAVCQPKISVCSSRIEMNLAVYDDKRAQRDSRRYKSSDSVHLKQKAENTINGRKWKYPYRIYNIILGNN